MTRYVHPRLAVVAAVVALMLASVVVYAVPEHDGRKTHAQKEGRDTDSEAEGPVERRGNTLHKIRQGSLLWRDRPLRKRQDLRSDLERVRDEELHKHYQRVAELDVIAEVAQKMRDTELLDRAEQVRRSEVRRFMLVMQRFLAAARRGGPMTMEEP